MTRSANIDIAHLSPQERLDLIGELCESLEAEDFPISDAWRAELDRRNARFAESRGSAVPWSQIRARLRPSKA